MKRDHARGPGDDAFIGDLPQEDSDIATLSDHVQRSIGEGEFRGDPWVELQETADQSAALRVLRSLGLACLTVEQSSTLGREVDCIASFEEQWQVAHDHKKQVAKFRAV